MMNDLWMSKFIRNATSVGAINIADRAVTVALGVFLARTLEPVGYGTYAFIMSQVTLVALLAKLGLPDLILREFAANRGRVSGANPRLLLRTAVVLSSSSTAVLILLGFIIVTIFYDGPNANGFLLGLVMIAPMALFEIYAGALRGLGHVIKSQFITTLALTTVVLLLCVAVLFSFHRFSAVDALTIRLLALCVFCAIVVFAVNRSMKADFEQMSHLIGDVAAPSMAITLKTSMSFLVIGVLHVLFVTIDQLMLGYMVGESSVAIFKVAAEGAQIVAFAYVAGNAVLAPEYSRIFATQDIQLLEATAKKSAAIILTIALPIFLTILFFSTEIVEFAFGSAYVAAAPPLCILAAGHFVALLFGDPLYILNMTKHQQTSMRLTIFAVAINVALNAIAIPRLGVTGAALATTFSFVSLRFAAYLYVRFHLAVECSAISGLRRIGEIGIKRG